MRVLITGGGTAGHINPALAIAAKIKKENPDAGNPVCRGKGQDGNPACAAGGISNQDNQCARGSSAG